MDDDRDILKRNRIICRRCGRRYGEHMAGTLACPLQDEQTFAPTPTAAGDARGRGDHA